MSNIVISDDPGHSQSTRALLGELRQQAAELAKDYESLETDVKRLRDTDPVKLTEPDIAMVREIPIRRLYSARRELALRQRVQSEWFPKSREDRAVSAMRAEQLYRDQVERVRQKLIAAGFLDGLLPDTNLKGIDDQHVHRHPEVRAAKGEMEAARNRVNNRDIEQLNETAIAELTKQMEGFKQRTIAALA